MLMQRKLRSKPKWLELGKDEEFVRGYIQNESLFMATMLAGIGIFIASAGVTISGAPDTLSASFPVVATSILSMGTMFAAKKVYVTSQRIIVGKNAKDCLAIPLEGITALETITGVAGKVRIHHSIEKPIVISTFNPMRKAQEIQAVCAASQS